MVVMLLRTLMGDRVVSQETECALTVERQDMTRVLVGKLLDFQNG